MWPNLQETADLVTFTEEILNGNFFYVFYIFCVALFAVMKFSSSEPCQTSAMASFTKTVNGFQPLIIFAQHSILDPSKL